MTAPGTKIRFWAAGGTAVGGVACGVLEVLFQRQGGILVGRWAMLALLGGWFAAFALAAWSVLHLPRRVATLVVLVGALAFNAVALTKGPQLSDDLYRYAWDGRVQAAGNDAYRYPPDDPHLARFREPWLWPPAAACAEPPGRPPGCTRINRAGERTIYPPVAELWFLGLHAVVPFSSHERGLQAADAVVTLGLVVLLLCALGRLGRNPSLAVLYAWCPIAVIETSMDAHVDVLAVLAAVAALWALERRRSGLGGALLGVAIAVKIIPGMLLPAGLRRHPVRVLASAAAVVGLSYLPHVLAVGPRVLGYLPGYLDEEQYATGGRFLLLGAVGLDGVAAQVVAALVLLGAAVWVAAYSREPTVTGRARAMAVIVFLVVTPAAPWYSVLLVALAALDGAWEVLAVAAAGYPLYFANILSGVDPRVGRASYGLAAAVVAAAAVGRRRRRLRSPPPQRLSPTPA